MFETPGGLARPLSPALVRLGAKNAREDKVVLNVGRQPGMRPEDIGALRQVKTPESRPTARWWLLP